MSRSTVIAFAVAALALFGAAAAQQKPAGPMVEVFNRRRADAVRNGSSTCARTASPCERRT